MTGIFHHVGTFLLLVATALLLVTTITSPVINDMGILRVNLSNRTSSSRSAVSFGTFGYCVLNTAETNDDDDWCTGARIGYNPLQQMARIEQSDFNDAEENTSKALTRVMVLHPVACVLSFIAFLLALGSGFIGAIFAAAVSTLAFIVTVVVMACDFVLFGIVRNKVNGNREGDSTAEWSVGIWTILAAMILLFLATVIVLLTCCSKRIHDKRARRNTGKEAGYTHTTTTRKRRFWQRKNRY
jgi:uncharacterized membrane protein